jgi:hypothetical protein
MQVNLRRQVHEVCALPALTRLEKVTTWSTHVEKRVLKGILEYSYDWCWLDQGWVDREQYRVIDGRVN